MDAPDVTRTTARRRSSGWIRGALAIFGSGIVAAAVALFVYVQSGGWPAVAGAVAALIAGAILAGLQAGPPFSRRRVLAYLLMPLPTIAVAFVWIGAGLLGVYAIVGAIIGLWEIPLALTLFLVAARHRRDSAERQRQRLPFSPPPLEGELAAATRNSRSLTVIREYIDDQVGQKHLDADTVALLPHGYELVSVEATPRPEGLHRGLGQIYDVLSIFSSLPARGEGDDRGRIVATFQRRKK